MPTRRRETRIAVLKGQYRIRELIMFTEVIIVTHGQLTGNKYAIVDDTNFEREGGVIVLAFVYKWPWSRKPRITATQHNNGSTKTASTVLQVNENLKITIEHYPQKARRS